MNCEIVCIRKYKWIYKGPLEQFSSRTEVFMKLFTEKGLSLTPEFLNVYEPIELKIKIKTKF